jgi:hypothetical protein
MQMRRRSAGPDVEPRDTTFAGGNTPSRTMGPGVGSSIVMVGERLRGSGC